MNSPTSPDPIAESNSARQSTASEPEMPDEALPDEPSFGDILSEFEQQARKPEGETIDGTVISVSDDGIFVDVNRKTDGILDAAKYKNPDGTFILAAGMPVKVMIAGYNSVTNNFLLSTHNVVVPKDWSTIQAAFDDRKIVVGRVMEVVKGGLRVDVGARAFMPASRSGARDLADMEKLVGSDIECRITKLDTENEDVVVDRRQVMEELAGEAKRKAFEAIHEGDVVSGKVRNLTDFGAFIDLGGVDGLLHVADMAWTRIAKPADLLTQDEAITVKVLKINPETKKIQLGLKQLQADPWTLAGEKFHAGERVTGTVQRLTDFGAFVELMSGVEGLIHVSEMSWSKKIRKPSDMLKAGEQVEVQVLAVNTGEKRISLGLKQIMGDPIEDFAAAHPVGSAVEGKISNLARFGAFVDLGNGVEGMIHIADITNEKRLEHPKDAIAMGQDIRAQVLEVDRDRRRIRLGLRQLEPTALDKWVEAHQVGETITGRVADVRDSGARIDVGDGVMGFCKTKKEAAVSGPAAAAGPKVDVSVLSSMLKARWKQGADALPAEKGMRPGQVLTFRILAMDAAQKRLELEPAG